MDVNGQEIGQKVAWGGVEGGMTKAGGNIWGDGCVHYLDKGDGFKV